MLVLVKVLKGFDDSVEVQVLKRTECKELKFK